MPWALARLLLTAVVAATIAGEVAMTWTPVVALTVVEVAATSVTSWAVRTPVPVIDTVAVSEGAVDVVVGIVKVTAA